ncbi:NRDE family protein [Halomicrococcus gelatinilyticus]|uniref:NRDE family protein n=1 Tax=Halomicrococcus gelatinilyticus TaxID=1702103 RepID=UPI002E10BCDB
MCTLIVAWQVFDDAPVVAAANRDEALGRPSLPPDVIDADPAVVAPQDEEAGGTWIGYNEHGLFVGVTNRRADVEGERSRGLLVRDALARESADGAVQYVEHELANRDYAGFNLFVADADTATVLEWDGVLRATHLDPGVHVLVNEGLNDVAPKAERLREAVRPEPPSSADEPAEWLDHVEDVLADHDLDACVHGDGYGTRSSSVVVLRADGTASYRFADGPPCETEYRDVAEGQL